MDIFVIYKKKEGRDIGSKKMDEILKKEAMMVVLARGEERVQVRDKIINLWKRCHGLHGNLIKLVFRVREHRRCSVANGNVVRDARSAASTVRSSGHL